MSDYFNPLTNRISDGVRAIGAQINNVIDQVSAAFDMFPSETRLKRGTVNYASDTGTANTYLISLPYAPPSYTAGMEIVFLAANSNTGASTVNVNSLGVKNLARQDGSACVAGDIVGSRIITARYNSTTAQFEIQSTLATITDPTIRFPNLTVPVTTNSAEMNYSVGVTSAIQTQINSKMNSSRFPNVNADVTASDEDLSTLAGASGYSNYQAITESGTWTKPTGLTGNEIALIEEWGGGGGSGGMTAGTYGGTGGGGGGDYACRLMRVSNLGATESVIIGAGGAAGTPTTAGGVGGNTSFGTHLTAGGGGGSHYSTVNNGTGGGGGGGLGAAGDSSTGTSGGAGGATWPGQSGGAGGAGSTTGNGGDGTSAQYGGGGGGGGARLGGYAGGNGGKSTYGGGGGSGGNTGAGVAGTAGASLFGGSGGAVGEDGNAPGGGAGGMVSAGATANGKAGARGECRITVFR